MRLSSAAMLRSATGEKLEGTWIESVYLGGGGMTREEILEAIALGAEASVVLRVVVERSSAGEEAQEKE